MKQGLILLAILFSALSAFPITYYVDASRLDDTGSATNWATAKKTIQAAADLTADGDTVLVTNGVYNAGGKVTPGYSLTNRVCITTEITVQSINGPDVTLIQGAPGSNGGNDIDAVRGVFMGMGSTLAGFTVTNGYTSSSGDLFFERSGGGVWMEYSCAVSNCVLIGNEADSRGGGANLWGGGTLNNCTLQNNSSGTEGGGAFLDPGATLNNCTLSENSAFDSGGGVYLTDNAILNNCVLSTNLAGHEGGGVYLSGGGTLNNCSIIGNSAIIGGGAKLWYGGELNDCIINGNSSNDGGNDGGVSLYSGGILNNCILSGNSTEGSGGGAGLSSGGELNNCLLYGNSTSFGSGGGASVHNGGVLNNCTVISNSAGMSAGGIEVSESTINNCIVWGNIASEYENDIFNDRGTVRYTCASDGVVHGIDNCITNNPIFIDTVNSNFQLQASSPCVATGNNTYASTGTDLAGNPRIINGLVDMGAYEETTPLPTYTITTTAGVNGSITPANPSVFQGFNQTVSIQPDGGYHLESVTIDGLLIPLTNSYTFFDVQTNHTVVASFGINPQTYFVDASRPDDSGIGTSWATAKQSIQAAVDLVAPSGTVWVTNGIYDIGSKVTPGRMLKNRVCITRAMELRSVNGPEVTVIQGNKGASNGGYDSSAKRGVFMKNGCTLSGFTVTNGYTLGGGLVAYEAQGGGIWLSANCVVSNCIVTGNAASYGGGGVSLYYGGTLNNSLIIGNNSRSYGGAGVILKGQGVVNNCTVSDNHAGAESGGGLRMFNEGTLNNCIIWGNSAPGPNDIAKSYTGTTIRNTCSSSEVTHGVDGCITINPLFVDSANGNYQLQYGSPCINSGNNTYAPASPYDLAGNPRVIDGTVEMGAYEYNPSTADSNQDGIPDYWYLSYGLDCTSPSIGFDDPDNDWQSTGDEFIAGFDPTNGMSYFRITGFTNMPSSRIHWDSVPGRVYSVYWSTNLIDGFQLLETSIPWTAGSYTDDNHNSYDKGFYQIGVELEP